MFIFNKTVIFVFLITAVTTKELENWKIPDNSSDLIPDRFPFLVGVISNTFANDQIVCTGTLITLHFVLTSAFCVLRLQSKVQLYHKSPTAVLQYRSAASVQVHPGYNSALRVNDLCLIKLTKSFTGVHDLVRLSSKVFKNNKAHLECVVAGIGRPLGRGYQMPVHVKYGRTACNITKSNPSLKYIINYTWPEFMCAKMIGRDASSRQSCDYGDPLLCHGNRQYGIFSYGYRIKATSTAMLGTETSECRDPDVQSRFLFVNKRTGWIKDTVSRAAGHAPADKDGREAVDDVTDQESYTTRPMPTKSTTEYDQSLDYSIYGYLVYLTGRPDEPICGGTLMTAMHVLTTAFCTFHMSEIKVTVAINEKHYARGIYVYHHPEYDMVTQFSDISIIVLNKPLHVSEYVRLPEAYEPLETNETVVQKCMTLSKQYKSDFRIMPIKAKYGPNACLKSNKSNIQKTVENTWRGFSCGMSENEKMSNKGDPLICNGVQYGINSHFYTIKLKQNNEDFWQVRYLLVNNYRKWINRIVTFTGRSSAKRLRTTPALAILTAGMLHIALQYINS